MKKLKATWKMVEDEPIDEEARWELLGMQAVSIATEEANEAERVFRAEGIEDMSLYIDRERYINERAAQLVKYWLFEASLLLERTC